LNRQVTTGILVRSASLALNQADTIFRQMPATNPRLEVNLMSLVSLLRFRRQPVQSAFGSVAKVTQGRIPTITKFPNCTVVLSAIFASQP